MDPATMAMLGSLGGMMKGGGGGTKVTQSVSNTSWAGISANISGISNNPVSGDASASQAANAAAQSTGDPVPSGSNLMDSLLGSGSNYGGGVDTSPPSALTTPAGGFFTSRTMLYVVGVVGLLGLAYWADLMLMRRRKRG